MILYIKIVNNEDIFYVLGMSYYYCYFILRYTLVLWYEILYWLKNH